MKNIVIAVSFEVEAVLIPPILNDKYRTSMPGVTENE